MRRIFTIATITTITIMGCGPQATQQATQTQQTQTQATQTIQATQQIKQPEVVKETVLASALVAHYRTNAAKADATFTGKLVTIKILVEHVKKSSDGKYYITATGWGDGTPAEHCVCYFAASAAGKLAALPQGQPCHLQGVCLGIQGQLDDGFPQVVLTECKILN